MGTRGRGIVGMDADELIKLLNKAFADEWLAYYQYWLGAKIVKGPTKDNVIAELDQHATEELNHAVMVADRIVQLGGTPVPEPKGWYDLTNCGYERPDDPYVRDILRQNIKGEQCAIEVYADLARTTRDADPVTYEIVQVILQQEVEHEEDLEALLEDLDLLVSREIKA